MNYNKSPFNWVGNKFKHIEVINSIIRGEKFNKVIDVFLGSGNVLLNLDVESKTFIGNDKIKLLPKIYETLINNEYIYVLSDIEDILNKFNRFSTKDSYYTFRDYWNEKYLSNDFNKDFIMETILLLKMCSNSMVRFNPKQGYFNQGFRGLGKKNEFFTETMKNLCVNELNNLTNTLKTNNYKFINKDFLEIKDIIKKGENNLIILDPPYILRKDMYDTDWTEKHDLELFDLLENTKSKYIYFNYLERDGVINTDLLDFINKNKLKYIEINDKTLSGQGRSENIKTVKEVIVTNV
ncbi:MAG: DNA adenine methylase [Peptostreptococcaceae bacterium]